MTYTDNPIADFEAYEYEREKNLSKRPKCDICGEPIQEDYYYEIGEKICEGCMTEYFRKEIEDYE